ncbi:MAG: hypothetical protein ABW185_06315 [Sedimenticola sp.]
MNEKEVQKFDVMRVPDDASTGYLIEVSLEYPAHLHDDHNCLPLCPVKRHVADDELSPYATEIWQQLRGKSKRAKGEKLLCTLEDKERYVLHYRNLKLYLQLGMRIKRIHHVLEFYQEAWLKPYIDFNTRKRAEAKTEFERIYYKLMNNSVFGKLMECQRKHVDVSLTNSEKKLKKLTAKPTFRESRIFNENLVGVNCKRNKVLINRPIFAGQTVLDLSKVLMYQFWYGYLKRKYGNQVTLLMSDTDSFLFHVVTEDIYADMKKDSHHFDTSEYPTDHFLYSSSNRKIPGKFKDELNGKVAEKFCGLRSKMYAVCHSTDGEETETKKAKGIQKATTEKDLRYEMYENVLMDKTEILSTMDLIRSRKHNLYCETVTKKSLSPFDDKRYILNDGISSLSYGHYCVNHTSLDPEVCQEYQNRMQCDTSCATEVPKTERKVTHVRDNSDTYSTTVS